MQLVGRRPAVAPVHYSHARCLLDRALQLNTAALAVMGAVFLGLGHESVVMPLLLAVGGNRCRSR